jgi:Uma2 family endonuclease
MLTYPRDLNSLTHLNDEQFYELCVHHPDLKFELTSQGDLIIMSPTGGETGRRNANIITDFGIWNRQHKLGQVFDSSTCFELPNNAKYSPDVSWISQSRWDTLTPEQKEKFPAIAPDFVLELLSPSDILKNPQDKMREYITNGVKLAWLIYPKTRTVEIYRIGQEVEILHNPSSLSGEEVLPDFILDLTQIW